jgi:hypothetical protein
LKANHIPQKERILHRIRNLQSKLPNDGWGTFGGGNPYRKCLGCGRAEPQISYDNHGKGCIMGGIRNEIRYYRSLLINIDIN